MIKSKEIKSLYQMTIIFQKLNKEKLILTKPVKDQKKADIKLIMFLHRRGDIQLNRTLLQM